MPFALAEPASSRQQDKERTKRETNIFAEPDNTLRFAEVPHLFRKFGVEFDRTYQEPDARLAAVA
jgi:hypothetical protein